MLLQAAFHMISIYWTLYSLFHCPSLLSGMFHNHNAGHEAQIRNSARTVDRLIAPSDPDVQIQAIRLATYACRFPAVDLAKWAMLPQAVLALAWLVHEPLSRLLDGPKDEIWAGWSDPVCWILIVWFSLSGHALRGILINKGQVRCNPVQELIGWSTSKAALGQISIGKWPEPSDSYVILTADFRASLDVLMLIIKALPFPPTSLTTSC